MDKNIIDLSKKTMNKKVDSKLTIDNINKLIDNKINNISIDKKMIENNMNNIKNYFDSGKFYDDIYNELEKIINEDIVNFIWDEEDQKYYFNYNISINIYSLQGNFNDYILTFFFMFIDTYIKNYYYNNLIDIFNNLYLPMIYFNVNYCKEGIYRVQLKLVLEKGKLFNKLIELFGDHNEI
jgi:hypothetical protein